MSARAFDRWRLTLPLLLPTLGGLLYLWMLGAPARLIVVNAAALALALGCAMWGRLPHRPQARQGLAAAALAVLFLPPLLHHDVGGVSRWLPLWPFMLHSGTLLLPLVTALSAQAHRAGPWLLATAALALALQPDGGTLAGLAAASGALAFIRRSPGFALVSGGSLIMALATWNAGTLTPQEYTEGVLAHAWQSSPILAAGLAGLLFVLPGPLLLRAEHSMQAALALAALLAGLGVAAMIAPFPFPLIGYGAAPILGFGLALAVLSEPPQAVEERDDDGV